MKLRSNCPPMDRARCSQTLATVILDEEMSMEFAVPQSDGRINDRMVVDFGNSGVERLANIRMEPTRAIYHRARLIRKR